MKIDAQTAAAGVVLTTLLIAYVVGLMWGLIRRAHFSNIFELGVLFGVMYVGWTIRTWPTRHKGDGMLMSLGMAWRDSVITLVYLVLKLFGIVEVWQWIARFFQT